MAQSKTKKPTLDTKAALAFAGGTPTKTMPKGKKPPQRGPQGADSKSGMVPEGDVRLTANIRGDLHLRLTFRTHPARIFRIIPRPLPSTWNMCKTALGHL